MFTGLVEQMASVASIEQSTSGIRLALSCKGWAAHPTLGESICVSGCCLTVVDAHGTLGNTTIAFDVVPETLRCTNLGQVEVGDTINLERSLRCDALLGGHFVQGHIDGIESLLCVSGAADDEYRLRVSMLSIDQDTIVPKGSVAIDGVSLTVAIVGEGWFEVALVPTTLQETTLGKVSQGDQVNIETDILARTVVQTIRSMQQS